MKHGSLFSGVGGFDLAAQWMGWENKFHCEWNEFGQKVYSTPSFCAFSLIAVSSTPAIERPSFWDNAFRSVSAFSDKVNDVFFLLMVV